MGLRVLAALGGISGLAFSLMYKRYLGVLDASKHPKDLKARAKAHAERDAYAERQAYDMLRESLRLEHAFELIRIQWKPRIEVAVCCNRSTAESYEHVPEDMAEVLSKFPRYD